MKFTGITIGDPFGIGPEIVEKAVLKYLSSKARNKNKKFLIFGSKKFLKRINFTVLNSVDGLSKVDKGAIFDNFPDREGEIGKPSEAGGMLSFLYLETALKFVKNGYINELITAPISKHAWEIAGIRYKGHTEFLRDFFKVERVIMSFWSSDLKVALFTHHIPLKQVIEKTSEKELEESIKLIFEEIKQLKLDLEVIVAGINPHAGEEGTIGEEEEKIIIPVVEKLKKEGYRISGPYPSDSIFYIAKGRKDAIIFCFYHDQGLIPFKLLHFEDGVHITLGLPILRFSPVHGTAFDIAGKNIANPSSMINCFIWSEKFNNL
ncbi:MAG: 4-hydroxythreonine-4-phosphate dehydrogenase PdxA [Candidatus Aminicenantia bacterium]